MTGVGVVVVVVVVLLDESRRRMRGMRRSNSSGIRHKHGLQRGRGPRMGSTPNDPAPRPT